jgi:tetratricopeptide (TPR) repeat protein
LAAKSSKPDPLLSAFISHAKADEKKADAIAKALESKGLKCWIAPRDVKPGRSYGDEIIRGIESTRSFVLVLSKSSNDSAFVAREVERAVSKKKPIFAVRLADVQPAPSLELFISGTQWIDAFPGRLAAHVDRLATMLADEEGRDLPAPSDVRPSPRSLPKWAMQFGAAAAVLLVLGAVLALWPGQEQAAVSPPPETSLDTKPVLLSEPDARPQQQIAVAESSGDEMIVGGAPTPKERDKSAASLGLAGRDADYQTCETETGDDALAACDRAIAGGKFAGRELSYLYSDRGFLRMQKGDLDRALADLNEAARIDSSNFYAFWNRGAVYAAKSDYGRAQEDLTTALALNPDKSSKAKIEEALNAVTTGVESAVKAKPSDPGVITDPSAFWGQQEGSTAASSGYPAEAMPPPAAVMPASPSMDAPPGSSYGPAVEPMR